MSFFVILFLLVVAIIIMMISIYNKLIGLRNRIKNAWAQIDVQLQRRHDLIPNIVEVAKGYLSHEAKTLEAVVVARGQAMQARQSVNQHLDSSSVKELSSAEGALGGALSRLMVVAESYPDLKANTTMMQLSEELTSTENKVAFARQAYNDAVMIYNTQREIFPNSLIAGGFAPAEPWIAIDRTSIQQTPRITF